MRFLPAVLCSVLLSLSAPSVSALHFTALKQQTLEASEQAAQRDGAYLLTLNHADLDADVSNPVYNFLGVTGQVKEKAIKDAFCLNSRAARKAFLDTDQNFKCDATFDDLKISGKGTPDNQPKTFKEINEIVAKFIFPRVPRHWGVVLMHQSKLLPPKYTEGDGSDGVTYLCAAANADDDKDGHNRVIERWGQVYYKPGEGGGDHTERICLDLFAEKLFGLSPWKNYDNWGENPIDGQYTQWDKWPKPSNEFKQYRITLSFCTQLKPCVGCSKAIVKFQQGLRRLGFQLGDHNQNDRINSFCH